MNRILVRLGGVRLLLLVIGLGLIGLAWWQVGRVRQGLVVRSLSQDGIPLRFIAPAGATNQPGILIAHGFGGSQQLMLGYAYVLAHAGYGTMLWDFAGHAANPAPLDRTGDTLQGNIDTAYAALIAQPEIDPGRVALLGHSMGSGAVMSAGIADPARYRAVVAISPTGADVTPDRPPNLLLQAGQREARFAENAQQLLAEAGGSSTDFATGRARAFVLVPQVEHITILFSDISHQVALRWLDSAFGRLSGSDYADRRMVWYLLHLLGWLLALVALSPLLPKMARPANRPVRWRRGLGLALAPFAAAVLLALTNLLIDVASLGGLSVGGGFALWCLYMGLVWLLLGTRPGRLAAADLTWGVLLFAVLWLAFGALAQFVWLPWFLIPVRLVRWPLLAAAFLPWMWAAGLAQQGAGAGQRALWWLGQSILIPAGLLLTMQLVPGMGVLILVLPLLPLLFGVLTVAGGAVARPGAYAIGSALFFGWLVLAYFPLS